MTCIIFVASRWPKRNSKVFISNSLSGVTWEIWNKLGASPRKDHPVDSWLLVSSKQLLLFATPAGVKHWQLPVIRQRRTGINLPKNTFFLVQSAMYYHVQAITKRSCWSHFAGEIQRLDAVTWQSFWRVTCVTSERHSKMTMVLQKRQNETFSQISSLSLFKEQTVSVTFLRVPGSFQTR